MRFGWETVVTGVASDQWVPADGCPISAKRIDDRWAGDSREGFHGYFGNTPPREVRSQYLKKQTNRLNRQTVAPKLVGGDLPKHSGNIESEVVGINGLIRLHVSVHTPLPVLRRNIDGYCLSLGVSAPTR